MLFQYRPYLKNLTSVQDPEWCGSCRWDGHFSDPLVHLDVEFNGEGKREIEIEMIETDRKWEREKKKTCTSAFAICLSLCLSLSPSVSGYLSICLFIYLSIIITIIYHIFISFFSLSHVHIHTPRTATDSKFWLLECWRVLLNDRWIILLQIVSFYACILYPLWLTVLTLPALLIMVVW